MPIFEYRCLECDKDFELLVFGNQEVSCPACEGNNVKRLLSVFSHKSDGDFSSSHGSSCSSCGATSCGTCGVS
ncbi:MAG: zinc ribbon domain-containing protein [Desulfatiglandales bacterium]